MAITNFDEILELIIGWEKKLSTLYNRLGQKTGNAKSKAVIEVLKKQQEKTLHVLKSIDLRQYRHSEFVKNPPDYKNTGLSAPPEISGQSSPLAILESVLGYEEELLEYYTHVRDILVYKPARELMEMLVRFKLGHIKQVKSFMDSYDLVN